MNVPYKDPEKAREACRAYYHRSEATREKVQIRKRERVERNKKFVYAWLQNHPCVDCKEDDPIVLEFDHLGDKAGEIYQMAADGLALQRIECEIAKCEVVCANCHKRRTARRSGSWKYNLAWLG